MLRPRIIPCLLYHDGGLVKTTKFKSPKYVGDPINAVRILNEKECDELIFLDIDATTKGTEPRYALIQKLAAESRMPLCYGGGIKTRDQACRIINLGVEKVSISSAAISNPALIAEIASSIGRQSTVAVIDVRLARGFFAKGYEVCTHNGRQGYTIDLVQLIGDLQEAGVGEIVINSVDRDGEMVGYDLELARMTRDLVKVPMTFLGGAGSLDHIAELVSECGVIGAAAGSLFVFKGKFRAVLINYPTRDLKDITCATALSRFKSKDR